MKQPLIILFWNLACQCRFFIDVRGNALISYKSAEKMSGIVKSRFIRSFLYYVPYAVLASMTIPAIFYSTGNLLSAILGTVVAVILSYFGKSLVTVAASSAFAVLVTEFILKYV